MTGGAQGANGIALFDLDYTLLGGDATYERFRCNSGRRLDCVANRDVR